MLVVRVKNPFVSFHMITIVWTVARLLSRRKKCSQAMTRKDTKMILTIDGEKSDEKHKEHVDN